MENNNYERNLLANFNRNSNPNTKATDDSENSISPNLALKLGDSTKKENPVNDNVAPVNSVPDSVSATGDAATNHKTRCVNVGVHTITASATATATAQVVGGPPHMYYVTVNTTATATVEAAEGVAVTAKRKGPLAGEEFSDGSKKGKRVIKEDPADRKM